MNSPSRMRRRGVLLTEAVVAGVMLAAAMAMTAKLAGWTAAQRREAERRGWAVQEAANAMEGLAALPFDRLTTETARASAKLSASAGAVLPGGQIDAEVIEEDDGLPRKRIDLAVRWNGGSGGAEAPVRLTAWVAKKGARP